MADPGDDVTLFGAMHLRLPDIEPVLIEVAIQEVEAGTPEGFYLVTEELPPPAGRREVGSKGSVGSGSSPLSSTARSTSGLRARLLRVLSPPLHLLLSRPGPLSWPASFPDYQTQGIISLLQRDALLLSDEMGLGKTIQVIAAIRVLARLGQISNALVVVPAAVLSQWLAALYLWAPDLRVSPIRGTADQRPRAWSTPAHVHVVSYETLRSDAHLSRGRVWDLVVADEAQKIKNADVDVSRVAKQLLRRRAWALTGTPLENRLDDVASVLDFVRPRLPDSSPAAYRAVGPHLREELAGMQLRRRKKDVLTSLPPKRLQELTIPMGSEQRAAYDRALREGRMRLAGGGGEIAIQNVLELILRLKQLCNFDPVTGASAKLEDLAERLESLEGSEERALVFTQFTDDSFGTAALAARLARFNPLMYTGSLTSAERDGVIVRFKRDEAHRVLVISLRAGGQGLNLQEASYVFHFDRWWNPAVEDQATDRAHRMGQVRPVNVYGYSIEDSVEQRILEILESKKVLFEQVVEGVGIDVPRLLSREELLGVVGLGAPDPLPRSGPEPEGLHKKLRLYGI